MTNSSVSHQPPSPRESMTPVSIFGKPEAGGVVCEFLVDRPILPGGRIEVRNEKQASQGSLTVQLFSIQGVSDFVIAGNSIRVRKKDDGEWKVIGKRLGEIVREYFRAGGNLVLSSDTDLPTSEIEKAIQRVLDEEVNPGVAAHGGKVTLQKVEGTRAYLVMSGGCQGCGMAAVTLRDGVRVAIQRAVPEVTDVIDVTEHESGQNPYYQNKGSSHVAGHDHHHHHDHDHDHSHCDHA